MDRLERQLRKDRVVHVQVECAALPHAVEDVQLLTEDVLLGLQLLDVGDADVRHHRHIDTGDLRDPGHLSRLRHAELDHRRLRTGAGHLKHGNRNPHLGVRIARRLKDLLSGREGGRDHAAGRGLPDRAGDTDDRAVELLPLHVADLLQCLRRVRDLIEADRRMLRLHRFDRTGAEHGDRAVCDGHIDIIMSIAVLTDDRHEEGMLHFLPRVEHDLLDALVTESETDIRCIHTVLHQSLYFAAVSRMTSRSRKWVRTPFTSW